MGIESTIYVTFFLLVAFPFVAMRSITEKKPIVQELPDLSTLPTPPTFTHEPNDPVIYYILDSDFSGTNRNLKEGTFTCTARGYPAVSYYWEKDGRPFNLTSHPNRITQFSDKGSFIFRNLQPEDEGIYQCFATNGNGTAADRPIEFKRTWIGRFPASMPVTVDIELQAPFVHHCVPPSSEPDPRVYWILMGKHEEREMFKTINSSYISSDNHGSLYFHSVMDEHVHPNMDYACTAENTPLQGYKFGQRFRLNIPKNNRSKFVDYLPPQEQFISKDVVAVKGRSISLHCFFGGFPPPIPQWYKDDMPVTEKRGRIGFRNFGKSLEIDNAQSRDAGEYKCKYRNASRFNRMIKVQVESAPYWASEPPASVNSSEGETVSFICGVVGVPQPDIRFYKNGKEVKPSHGDEKFRIVANQHVIQKLERGENGQGDNAVYQCKAQNKHGHVWANFYLNIFRFPPILLDHVPAVEVILTQSLTLSCQFFGSPLPHVTWEVPPFSDLVKIQELETDHNGVARLRIDEFVASAVGNYSCHASNMFGDSTGYTSVSAIEATQMVKRPMSVTNVAGEPVALECQAVSDPDVHSCDIPLAGEYSENTLHIKHPKAFDSASYTCSAVPTTSVRSLEAFPLAHNMVSLSWKPPREINGHLIHYAISYCPILSNEADCHDANVYADTESIYIEGLSEQTTYRFTVRGVTRAGEGDPNSIEAETLANDFPAEPPIPPSLTVTGIADDHLNVTWHPGAFDEENPLPIGDTHYFIYRKLNSDEWHEARPIEGSFAVSIGGLEPGTTYEVVAVSVVAGGMDRSSLVAESRPYFYQTLDQLSFL